MIFKLKEILESGNLNGLMVDENYMVMTPLIKFVLEKDSKSVIELLKAGADPNVSDDWDSTPLEISCRNLDYNLSKILLDNGASPNYKNCMGKTPIMTLLYCCTSLPASESGEDEYNLLKLMLEYGADTYLKDDLNNDILDTVIFYDTILFQKLRNLIVKWRATLIIQYNIKVKLFRNRIKKRVEAKKLLLKDTKFPMDLIKMIKKYV